MSEATTRGKLFRLGTFVSIFSKIYVCIQNSKLFSIDSFVCFPAQNLTQGNEKIHCTWVLFFRLCRNSSLFFKSRNRRASTRKKNRRIFARSSLWLSSRSGSKITPLIFPPPFHKVCVGALQKTPFPVFRGFIALLLILHKYSCEVIVSYIPDRIGNFTK